MGPEERAEEVLSDWLEARRRGEDARGKELLRRHPELKAILQPRIDAVLVLDQLFASQQAPTRMPARVGGYRILRELGKGAMGAVYEAEQESLHRKVALKVLAPAIANDPEVVARFYREAQAAARLDHRNIVTVHEIGRDDFLLFYTMEFVEGRSLDDFLEERRKARAAGWTPDADYFRWVAGIFHGIASALHAAHEKEVIHRDIKPSNILLTSEGVPKVTDFGLARLGDVASTLTETGTILGTLQYMSPEQAMARRDTIDGRTDVYSLGATLYECLTLESPFHGEDAVELISHIVSDVPPAPRKLDPRIPSDLEVITLRSMAKDRRRRYPSAAEVRDDLERTLRSEPILAKRPGAAERGVDWARRHPARFATALAVTVALVVGSGAAAAGWYAGRPPLAPPTARGSLASAFAVAGRYDIAAAGIAPDAVVLDWACFLVSPAASGIAVVFQGPRDKLLDLCAFGQDGECLWTARGAWPDYDATLGRLDTGVSCLQSVVTRLADETREETLCVGIQLSGRTQLLLLEPVSGARHGSWRFDGILSAPQEGREVVAPLPEVADGGWSTRPRRIMVVGQRKEDAAPCLTVIEADGRQAQQLVFPLLGIDPVPAVKLIDLRADWLLTRPEVIVDTSEGLYVSFLVKDRLLAEPIAMMHGDAKQNYDERHGEGEFARLVAAAGGEIPYLRDLARRVTETR